MTEAMGVNGDDGNISREEVQAAIDKAVELRAIHAALKQGNNRNSPSHLRFLSAFSPTSLSPPSHFSANDYPVFTPSYEDEPLSGYAQVQMGSQPMSESCNDSRLGENEDGLDVKTPPNASSRKGISPSNTHIWPADDNDNASVTSSVTIPFTFLQNSPGNQILSRSRRRNSLCDFKSVSSCNKCNPAIVVPLTDSHASMAVSHAKSRGTVLSWLLPKLKRRQKHDSTSSPTRTGSEGVYSQFSVETLKKELTDANQKRDAAVREVCELRSSFAELKRKLESLESYCEELKKGLTLRQVSYNLRSFSDEEAMIEGFLQMVSESRLSVKQLCKILTDQIHETDQHLTENLNLLLKPYKLNINNSKCSKSVFHHLEALLNQEFYQDFENCVFQKNGCPKFLDPQKDRQAQFESFVALRNLSWNQVLKKGTKYYSEEFSKFCDNKMRCIIMTMNWTKPWPEPLLHSFFVASKCIWLLHLLAFSFTPPLTILRVEDNRAFDPHYMEAMFTEKQRLQSTSRVKIMVMPGFYVQDKILKCKVLCSHKSAV